MRRPPLLRWSHPLARPVVVAALVAVVLHIALWLQGPFL